MIYCLALSCIKHLFKTVISGTQVWPMTGHGLPEGLPEPDSLTNQVFRRRRKTSGNYRTRHDRKQQSHVLGPILTPYAWLKNYYWVIFSSFLWVDLFKIATVWPCHFTVAETSNCQFVCTAVHRATGRSACSLLRCDQWQATVWQKLCQSRTA